MHSDLYSPLNVSTLRSYSIFQIYFIVIDISLNVRKEANIVNPLTNHPLELDVWIESLGLGFEFQVYGGKEETGGRGGMEEGGREGGEGEEEGGGGGLG